VGCTATTEQLFALANEMLDQCSPRRFTSMLSVRLFQGSLASRQCTMTSLRTCDKAHHPDLLAIHDSYIRVIVRQISAVLSHDGG